jgi:cobalt-zinc-cadmium efflux system membrane fusion protein
MMLATMLVQGQAEPRLVVPASAVVRENNADYVFVAKAGALPPARGHLGHEERASAVVNAGLKAGETIVVEGGFHLNTERNTQATEG